LIFFLLAFLIKLPVFGFHLWLTKAHVEAPVIGSMILAGLLLKLGVYGVIRILRILGGNNSCRIPSFFFFWGLVSMIVVSMICFRSIDLKILVAYSSVVHMSLIFVSF
jgi:NADH-ubiquinone oxidoreductase chain 4